jgi:hypothetical protein
MLPQVILPVESLAAFGAHVALLATVNDKMQCQLLLPLKSFQANCADVRPFRVVALLVARQVILALQSSTAYVADESSFKRVPQEMLLQELALRVSHVAFWTAIKGRAIECCGQSYFAWNIGDSLS